MNQGLERLFLMASRVVARTARGILSHIHVNALTTSLASRLVRAGYQLTEFDKEILKEIMHLSLNVATLYVDHHDRENNTRFQGTPEDIFRRHAEEIYNKIVDTVISRARSRGYDYIFGKPINSSSLVLKQMISAALDEVYAHWQSNS